MHAQSAVEDETARARDTASTRPIQQLFDFTDSRWWHDVRSQRGKVSTKSCSGRPILTAQLAAAAARSPRRTCVRPPCRTRSKIHLPTYNI